MRRFLFVTNEEFDGFDYIKSILVHILCCAVATSVAVLLVTSGVTGVYALIVEGLWLTVLVAISISSLMATHARLKGIGYPIVLSWVSVLIITACALYLHVVSTL